MRIKVVRCCDYHPNDSRLRPDRNAMVVVPESEPWFYGYFDEALQHDHGGCQDSSCDIREALDNGYETVAYWLLDGATDPGATATMVEAARFNLGDATVTRLLGTHLYDCPDWDDWKAHFDRYGRECAACGAFTFADDIWEPERCGNCLEPLPGEESHDL